MDFAYDNLGVNKDINDCTTGKMKKCRAELTFTAPMGERRASDLENDVLPFEQDVDDNQNQGTAGVRTPHPDPRRSQWLLFLIERAGKSNRGRYHAGETASATVTMTCKQKQQDYLREDKKKNKLLKQKADARTLPRTEGEVMNGATTPVNTARQPKRVRRVSDSVSELLAANARMLDAGIHSQSECSNEYEVVSEPAIESFDF